MSIRAFTDAELLSRSRRRRRWVVRMCLSLFFLLILIGIGVILLKPSGMTAEEAETALSDLKGENTRTSLEHIFGKPYRVETDDGGINLFWQFITQGVDRVDICQFKIRCCGDGSTQIKGFDTFRMEGWSAWTWRWTRLKSRLGLN